MAEVDQAAADETVRRLTELRAELLAKIWPTAVEAGRAHTPELVRELVRLKADVDAVDFALTLRPSTSV